MRYACPNKKSWQHISNLQLLPSYQPNPSPLPAELTSESADFLVVERTCNQKFTVPDDFQFAQARDQLDFYVRKGRAAKSEPPG